MTTTISAIRSADPPGDDHPGTPGRFGPPVATCTKSSPRMSANGVTCTRWKACCSPTAVSLTLPIGIPGGKAEEIAPLLQPAVTRIWPRWIGWLLVDEVEQQVAGVAHLGLGHALGAVGQHPGRDGAAVVGDQGHHRPCRG